MKKLHYILILMILPILGVIVFQIYWVVNTYHINELQFEKDVKNALIEAVQSDLIEKTKMKMEDIDGSTIHVTPNLNETDDEGFDNLLKILGNSDSLKADNVTIQISGTDSLSDVLSSNMFSNFKDTTIVMGNAEGFNLGQASWQDMITRVISEMIGLQHNLDTIDSLYRIELASRFINVNYELALFYGGQMIKATTPDTLLFANPHVVYNVGKLYSEASEFRVVFPEKVGFLLLNMWISLSASLLLVVVVIGSFIYMLLVILRQKKLSEMKNDFISNMTHELKTPISTVSAAIEAMQNFGVLDDMDKTDKYLNISKLELSRLNSMVEKVLDISAYEKNRVTLNKESLILSQLLADTCERFRMRNGINLTIVNECTQSIEIFADRMHFQNLINNLLDNAIKYCDRETIIYVKCGISGNLVEFSVKDNGIGIPKENQKYIFDKFYRVPGDHMHLVKGFGLGLSYVKHVVDGHNGIIKVNSKPGMGSEFIIQIPVTDGSN
ncbi:MAG: HAMP domain-containing histidine kinase [Bacteroidales bacterium]|nr:HAMP domain-containing histidine kinase [Bacteroidales bacterium]